MTDLRERLIAATGFDDKLSALHADRALAVVAAWLREEAQRFMDQGVDMVDRDRRMAYWYAEQADLLNSLAARATQ